MWVAAGLELPHSSARVAAEFRGADTVPGHCGAMLHPTGRQRLLAGSPLDWSCWDGLCGAGCSRPQASESLEAPEKGESQWEVIWVGKGSCELCLWEAGAGRAAGGAYLERRGPQAHPHSAIDCRAFPINYSLIMENRQHWLHGSGSSSHVAVAGRGTGQPCLHLPARAGGSHLGDSDSRCSPCPGQAAVPNLSDGTGAGWRWEPREVCGCMGNCPVPAREGRSLMPKGQLAGC